MEDACSGTGVYFLLNICDCYYCSKNKINVMEREIYIVDGRKFKTYDEVIEYCEKNNYRVTNTETIKKGVYLISVTSIYPLPQYHSL